MTDPPSAVLVHLSVTNVLVFDQQQYQRILITYNGNFQGNFRKLHVLRPCGHALFTATVSSTLATKCSWSKPQHVHLFIYILWSNKFNYTVIELYTPNQLSSSLGSLQTQNVTVSAKTVPNGTLVFREIPFWNIEATAVLLCCGLVTLDVLYN